MIEYVELIEAAIKACRKAYILEPTTEGKKVWLESLTHFKKELYLLKTGVSQ